MKNVNRSTDHLIVNRWEIRDLLGKYKLANE